MIEHIQWLQHGSFLLQKNNVNIFINPCKIAAPNTFADIILITHDHYEHFSLADIDKLRQPHTQIITNEKVARHINGATLIRTWQSINTCNINIQAVPAYSPSSLLHPLEDGGLGFVISMNYYDIYYAGDTQIIPEMHRLRPDIAILPIDGNGTMSIDEATEAVSILRPRWVIPSNWGKGLGGATPLDVLEFKRRVEHLAQVVVPMGNLF